MVLQRVLLIWVSCIAPCAAAAAELERETEIAYERYLEGLARAFALETSGGDSPLEHISAQARARLRSGDTLARPGQDDGILEVPGGLIHHWRGAVFIPDVSLELVLATAQDYGSYASVYDWVIRSTLLRHVNEPAAQRDRFWTFLRIERSASVVTSTLDLWTEIEYRSLRHGLATAVSSTDCIRQVEDPGEPGERRLKVGKGSGYLWRANTYASYLERDGGVYIDLQTVGLSRGFPPLLGWIIEPIARRLGRGSADDSLKQLRRAVVRGASRPPAWSKGPEAVEPSSSLSPAGWCGEPARGRTIPERTSWTPATTICRPRSRWSALPAGAETKRRGDSAKAAPDAACVTKICLRRQAPYPRIMILWHDSSDRAAPGGSVLAAGTAIGPTCDRS